MAAKASPPSSKVATVRRMMRYNQKVFETFERSAQRLGWETATKDHGIGHLSIKDTLVHILNVHEAWFVAIAQGSWDVFEDPSRRKESINSWSDLARYRRRVWTEVDRFLSGVDERALQRRVKAPWMPGKYTLEDAIFQTTFEQAHHLGEIIAVYWQLERPPPQMMWLPTLLGTRVSVR